MASRLKITSLLNSHRLSMPLAVCIRKEKNSKVGQESRTSNFLGRQTLMEAIIQAVVVLLSNTRSVILAMASGSMESQMQSTA